MHEGRLPVTFSKWKHLQELKPVLDTLCHRFYDDIPHFEEQAKIDTKSEKLQKIMQKLHLVKNNSKPKIVDKTKGRKAAQKMNCPSEQKKQPKIVDKTKDRKTVKKINCASEQKKNKTKKQ